MRHARDEDLDQLESLLVELRRLPGLTERSRGVFCRRTKTSHTQKARFLSLVRSDVEAEAAAG
jgi:hypothetical protein